MSKAMVSFGKNMVERLTSKYGKASRQHKKVSNGYTQYLNIFLKRSIKKRQKQQVILLEIKLKRKSQKQL